MSAWWPFGRRKRDAPAPTEAARPTGRVEPGEPAATAAHAGDAWRDLPPLRPSAPAIELTAPVQRLADTMTSTQHTGVTNDELGHARSADGPAGTVVGLLQPRARHRERVQGGALIYATAAPEPVAGASAVPLRRSRPQPAATSHDGPPPGDPPVVSALPTEPVTPDRLPVPTAGVQAPGPQPTGELLPPAFAGAQRMPATPHELPAVTARSLQARERAVPAAPRRDTPSMPVAVPESSPTLTTATPTPTTATLPASPSPVAPTTSAATTGPASPSTPSTVSTPPGLTTTTVPANVPTTPGGSGPSLGSDAQQRVERSPLVGATRIVRRIGEPLRERPASMMPAADAGGQALPLAIEREGARLPPTAVPKRSLPDPGVVPDRAARPVASIDQPSSHHASMPPTPVAASNRPAPGATRPLVGSRPSIQRLVERPTGVRSAKPTGAGPGVDDEPVPVRWGPIARRDVQRAPEGVPADLRAELEPVLGTPLDDVKVHRDADTGEAARQLSAKAFTAGGEVFLPDWHGSTSGGEARTILTHELTHVAQQRRLGSALPDEASPAGTSLESEARAVAGQGPAVPIRPVAPSRAPNAPQRLAGEQPSPLVRALPHRPGGGMSPAEVAAHVQVAATAAGLTTSTLAAGAPAAAERPPQAAPARAGSATDPQPGAVQRQPDDVSSGPTAASTDATPAATPDDPAQLDELARRLYPRFRTRLRHDLLADRERSGRLFDVR